MRLVPLRLGVLGVLLLLGWPSIASAQSVERGRELYLEAEFEGAVRAFSQVLASPTLNREDALEAERYLTALRLMLEDEATARLHARAAVALDPTVRAPEGSPPSADALLRELAGDQEARLSIRGQADGVSADLRPVPTGLVERLRLRCGEATEEGPPPSVSLSVAGPGAVECEATALTGSGASLFLTSETVTVGIVGAMGAVEEEREGTESSGAPIWPWLVGGAAALVAIGIVIVIVAVASGGGDQAAFGDTRVEGW